MPIGATRPVTVTPRARSTGHRREGTRTWNEDDGNLLSRCWCDRVFVRVPADLVRRNLTFPCELDKCVNMARAYGWRGPDGHRRTAQRRGTFQDNPPEQMSRFYED